jgi:hypothetical protein
VIIFNFAVLLTSIGVAIFIGALLNRNFGVDGSVAYPGTIFLVSGLGMYFGFRKSADLLNKE